jgi:hypothetical protein
MSGLPPSSPTAAAARPLPRAELAIGPPTGCPSGPAAAPPVPADATRPPAVPAPVPSAAPTPAQEAPSVVPLASRAAGLTDAATIASATRPAGGPAGPLNEAIVCTWWASLFQPRGWRWSTSWATFAARCAQPDTFPTKDAPPRWSAATFQGDYRRLANVEATAAVVLDLDGQRGEVPTRERVVEAFDGRLLVAHTTWSSTPERPRWRVVLPLSRLVNVEEHDRCWRAATELVERTGIAPDYGAKDASHAWAVPAQRPDYEYLLVAGEPLDVDAAVARFPAPAPPQPLELPPRDPPPDDLARLLVRARAYLSVMDPAISGSGGHMATWRAALALVRGFGLPPDDALHLLVEEYNPRCSPPWTLRQLQHKVADAARARVPLGWLADSPTTIREEACQWMGALRVRVLRAAFQRLPACPWRGRAAADRVNLWVATTEGEVLPRQQVWLHAREVYDAVMPDIPVSAWLVTDDWRALVERLVGRELEIVVRPGVPRARRIRMVP